MRTLTNMSIVTVACAASVWLFVAPQLVSDGEVAVGGFFEIMVVLPTLIGLPAALVGAIAGVGLVRRADRGRARTWMTVGQVSTLVLAVTIVVWSQTCGTTGWELLVLPMALMLAQPLVAVGLLLMVPRRRRQPRRADSPPLEFRST